MVSHILLKGRKHLWKWDMDSSEDITSLSILTSNFYWIQRNGCFLSSVYQKVISDPSKNLIHRVSVDIFRGVNLSWWIDTGYTEVKLHLHQMWKQQIRKPAVESRLPWMTFPHVSWRPLAFPSAQLYRLDLLPYLFKCPIFETIYKLYCIRREIPTS